MAPYRVDFVDHGNNVYEARVVNRDDDESAIAEAHLMNVPGIGAGFDLWQEDRLVHRHRN